MGVARSGLWAPVNWESFVVLFEVTTFGFWEGRMTESPGEKAFRSRARTVSIQSNGCFVSVLGYRKRGLHVGKIN